MKGKVEYFHFQVLRLFTSSVKKHLVEYNV